MKSLPCFAALIATVAVIPGSATAECVISSIGVAGGRLSADYDGLSPSPLTLNVPLMVVANDDCRRGDVAVRILPDGAGAQSIGSNILLQSSDAVLQANLRTGQASQPHPSAAEVGDKAANIHLGASGSGLDSEIVLSIPAGQDVPPGDYTLRVRVAAGEALRRGDPLDIVVRVKPFVGLAAASGTTLDLGVLNDGAQAPTPITFRAYANTPYRIELLSDNGWKLQRGRSATGGIDYDPILSGVPVGGSGERVARYRNVASGSEAIQFNARVGDVPRVAAGRYSDWVTVRIAADLGR